MCLKFIQQLCILTRWQYVNDLVSRNVIGKVKIIISQAIHQEL